MFRIHTPLWIFPINAFLRSWIFRTVLGSDLTLLSYLEMGIMNRMIFSFQILYSIEDFYSCEKKPVQGFYEIFKKLPKKNSVMECDVCSCCRSQLLQVPFSGIFFFNFQSILSIEQLWTTISKLFDIFSWNFPNIHFFVWSHFTCHLTKTNIWKQDWK